jgi:hypothetical protein
MIAAKIVVCLRPFQVLLCCASLIFATLDQQYRVNTTVRVPIVLILGSKSHVPDLAELSLTLVCSSGDSTHRHGCRADDMGLPRQTRLQSSCRDRKVDRGLCRLSHPRCHDSNLVDSMGAVRC